MANFDQYTNQYKVSKTLRFELIPVGETKKHIEENGILGNDTILADKYQKMKKTIDAYHKDFIERALSDVQLSKLDAFAQSYKNKSNDLEDKAKSLRKEIVNIFTKGNKEEFSQLNEKKLLKTVLPNWISQQKTDLFFDDHFKNYTTYFTGFNKNRMNMYSDEEKSTAIAYRLVNENLPRFLDNIRIFEQVREMISDGMASLSSDFADILNGKTPDDFFTVAHFNDTLTQKQIENYNTLIGGRVADGSKQKQQGINEYINLYNQKNPKAKLPKMKPLYKQILSDRASLSWLPESFENTQELLTSVKEFSAVFMQTVDELKSLLTELSDHNTAHIFVEEKALPALSVGIFGHYAVFSESFGLSEENEDSGKKKKAVYYSLAQLQEKADAYAASSDEKKSYSVTGYLSEKASEMTDILSASQEKLVSLPQHEANNLSDTEKDIVKEYLDQALALFRFVKLLYLPADAAIEKDYVFYGSFLPRYEAMSSLPKLYDKVRNFATKKPYSTEKIKLNFNCSTLLDGWDVSKERDNLGVLFRKGENYYLGILDKKHNKTLSDLKETDNEDCFVKIDYKLLPGPNKMLPKVFFSNSRLEEFAPSEEILTIYQNGTFKKGDSFSLNDCHKLIDFFKASIDKHPEWRKFEFRFSPTESYTNISDFYREVSNQGYRLTQRKLSSALIQNLVKDGKLYLFQIYNKDFSSCSKGKPNLHTLYWMALFAEENLNNVVYKLNGQAEMFYRKRSIPEENRVIHPAGQPIKKKNPTIQEETSVFAYDLVKDRRYTVDKFQFHVPITVNYQSPDEKPSFNKSVCTYLHDTPDIHILGIDRGERNLLYISLIDQNGHVVRNENGRYIQYSLNTITGSYRGADGKQVEFSTPYHTLLANKEKERDEQRKNWNSIENIKELKAGYLSQVVHHICRIMVKYNAIVVMEDLNSGFKRGRIKVEKQVYQKFEKALIDKLNYLVFKDIPADETGGLYHALQLTPPFKSFRELTKQWGFLFYIPAWNTSKIDPVTGFVDQLKPKYTNVENAQAFFAKFRSIRYDIVNDWFTFDFDYRDFGQTADGTRTAWTLCSYGELRYAYNKALNNERGEYERWNVTEQLKKLLDKYRIDYHDGGELKELIKAQTEKSFFAPLIKNLQVLLAMRYSSTEDEKDFILSPVADRHGEVYCSENHKTVDGFSSDGKPQDADANGAYNIARKGLMVLRQIQENPAKWTTKISNRDWLSFAQNSKQ